MFIFTDDNFVVMKTFHNFIRLLDNFDYIAIKY